MLAKAGINPYSSFNYSPNSEIEQVVAALGGTNPQRSDIMTLLPYFMAGNKQQTNNINPDFLKTIMTTNMMEGFNNTFFDEDTNKTY